MPICGYRATATINLALAGRGIQHAEPPVAVGYERAHAQLIGQGKGLAVIAFDLLDI